MKKTPIALVRFKKDLRCDDHAPLAKAISSGLPVVAVYCFEPSIMGASDWSGFHGQVTKQSLVQLEAGLRNYNIPLRVYHQECVETFHYFQKSYAIHSIFSHEETGNMLTYQRDIAVSERCTSEGVLFDESPNNGVIRKLHSRDDRMKHWKERMEKPVVVCPSFSNPGCDEQLRLCGQVNAISLGTRKKFLALQDGGEIVAQQRLDYFLTRGYSSYLYHIGRPEESTESCSRLSVFLTYGNLSLKQVVQATKARRKELAEQRDSYKRGSPEYKRQSSLVKHLDGFKSRLHWHDHFIQKLEMETDYEFKNIHPYYDRIRQQPNENILVARESGQTGFPLIDAAMRCLKKTGWINFRLRATVISFICNTCMQDRKYPAHVLARLFTDYEPGIHYSQCQMQAGTVGINQHRVYNPTKQLLEKDPKGAFIDKWVPELRNVPLPLKAEPWKIDGGLFDSTYGVRVGIDYPLPIIDIQQANSAARKVLRDLKKQQGFRDIAQDIFYRHGSRKNSWKKKR